MAGVCRLWFADADAHLEVIPVQDIFEGIPAYGIVIPELTLIHQPELRAANSGVDGPYASDVLNHKRLPRCFAEDHVLIVLVICLL